MQLLLFSFLALALGPLLVALARRSAWSTVAVDAFCVLTISGFVLLHILPECAEQAGWLALPLALVGFLAPALAERGLQRRTSNLRRLVLTLALLGMAAHDTLDGMALSLGEHGGELLAWAVILHRIPEGVGIWWIVPRTLGASAAVLVTAVVVVATVFGFGLGNELLGGASTRGLAMLQALLSGSLLHVVLHAHVPAPHDRTRWHFASFAGAIAAITVLAFVIHDHFPKAGEHGGPMAVFLELAAESAPALLLAYFLVGLCQAFLPTGWLAHMTRGPAFMQALRGVAIGLPLPVCSCGVVPIYRQLVRQGAALAAAIAFLVATPELEITAALLTWKLMGGAIALMRLGAAAALALGVGMLVGWFAGKGATATAPAGEGIVPAAHRGGLGQRLREAVQFGYGPAVDNTATWILMGLLLSALLMPYVDHDWIARLPPGIDVPAAALLGLPIYVCATGSTPLAAMLLAQGLSPGAVLAFLLTGPATNVTTFGMLTRLHGGRIAAVFAAAMWLGAVGLGYLANVLLPANAPALLGDHEHRTDWQSLALLLLAGVFLWSLLRQGVRPFIERLFESPANLVPGQHSGHDHDHDHGADCCRTEPMATADARHTGAGSGHLAGAAALPPTLPHAHGQDGGHGDCCDHGP